MHDKGKYITFPIGLLFDAPKDISKLCNIAINYTIYMHSKKLDEGSPHQKIIDAGKYFGYTVTNPKGVISSIESVLKNDYKVVTSIHIDVIEKFRSNYKSPFEIIVFMAFCGLRSIIGKKPYIKTTNKFWLSRMSGFEKSVPNENLSEFIKPFANDYQMKKIRNELENHWGLKYYSRYTRGFYVSFTMPIEDLVLQGEKRRKKYLERSKSDIQKEALRKVMIKLYT